MDYRVSQAEKQEQRNGNGEHGSGSEGSGKNARNRA